MPSIHEILASRAIYGNWTPSVGGDATYSAQSGTFIMIGKKIWAFGDMTINIIGTGSTTTISGLPVASSAASVGYVSFWANMAFNINFLACQVGVGSTSITLSGTLVAAASASGPFGVMGNGSRVVFGIQYES